MPLVHVPDSAYVDSRANTDGSRHGGALRDIVNLARRAPDRKGSHRWLKTKGMPGSSECCSSSRSSRRYRRWPCSNPFSTIRPATSQVAGRTAQVYLGVLLELLLIIANVGTAVVLYPIVRRQNEILSLGYVTARLMECVFIAAGIIFVLGIVSLRQDDPSASALAVSLAALKDWTFLLGPGFIVGWGNGLILGYLMYSSRLVPRRRRGWA